MSFRHALRGRALAVVTAVSFLSLPALAQVVVDDVRLPETRSVEGKTLRLNGAGLRTKVVKLYVGALYLEEPTQNAQEVIDSDQTKRFELHVLRDLSKKQVGDVIREGFEKNSGAEMSALGDRLDKLVEGIPALKRGDVMTVTYVPSKKVTIVDGPRNEPVEIEGEDFSKAMFRIWVGDSPAQESLKRDVLRGGSPKTAQR
jgi:hypothetical protein